LLDTLIVQFPVFFPPVSVYVAPPPVPFRVMPTEVQPLAVALMLRDPAFASTSAGVLVPVTVLLALVVKFPVCVHVPL